MAARLEVTLFRYRPHCFCWVNQVVLILTEWKSREVCIKARSAPASLTFKSQVNEHTTVNWPISGPKNDFISGNKPTNGRKSRNLCSEVNSTLLITSKLTYRNAWKALIHVYNILATLKVTHTKQKYNRIKYINWNSNEKQ